VSERSRRASIAAAGTSLAATTLSLALALVRPSSFATACTLAAMIALAVSLHAIGRTHAER
jgi:hypothetical protein